MKCRDNLKLWGRWAAMMQRCTNPKDKYYKNYGGRGIKVCDRWRKFKHFAEDMGEPPFAGATLERRDNNGDYEPGNCCWATRQDQMNNTRSNRRITHGGASRTIAEWARLLGFGKNTIPDRILRGWTPEQAVTKPKMRNQYG